MGEKVKKIFGACIWNFQNTTEKIWNTNLNHFYKVLNKIVKIIFLENGNICSLQNQVNDPNNCFKLLKNFNENEHGVFAGGWLIESVWLISDF